MGIVHTAVSPSQAKQCELGSQTQRHRNDPRKASGVHYTPPKLAQFLATEGLRELGDPPSVILDPACGGGELLEAVWRGLPVRAQQRAECIGLDTDLVAVDACRRRLHDIGCADAKICQADFLVPASRPVRQSSLFDSPTEPVAAGSVDLVIANPPYVRTQTLGEAKVGELTRQYGIAGRVDLYMAFAFAIADVLRPGGVMALLCSNRFLTTRAGTSLRHLLQAEFSVGSLFDLGDTRMFEAAVLPAIVIATKGAVRRRTRFVSVYRVAKIVDEDLPSFESVPQLLASPRVGEAEVDGTTLRVRRGILAPGAGAEHPWTVQDSATVGLVSELSAATNLTVGSLAKIRVGIKTTADSVFIRDDWGSLPAELQPERELLRPLLTHHVAERWRARASRKTILYPYESHGDRTVPVDLNRYPRTSAYLASHSDRLSAREYVTASGRQWFEIWVPQRAHLWTGPKVVFPDISEVPRFLVDTEGHLVNGDCYWAATSSVEVALLIAAIGNSGVARSFYDAHCGNQLYAGRRRFMTQYVERFPVPDPTSPIAEKIVALAGKLYRGVVPAAEAEAELEGLVRVSLGLERTGPHGAACRDGRRLRG